MKQMTLSSTLALAALVASPLGFAGPFVGGQSDDTYIEVGESTVDAGPHNSGLAGVGIDSEYMDKEDKVDIQFLAAFGQTVGIAQVMDMSGSGPDPDHSGLGVFSFVEVGDDVWFGEWSWGGAPNFSDRAVFYIGDKSNVSMPTSGTASYTVNGLNHFAADGDHLNGSIDVDFGGETLSGYLENADLGINVAAAIDIPNSSFSGTATAYNPSTSATLDGNGVSQGDFYGVDAAVIAGIATFANNPDYDTSFGGAR